MIKTKLIAIAIFGLLFSCKTVEPPKPVGPLPSERQLAWHDLEYYAFVHFNMNTFTDMEWGLGGESPETFNPTELDVRQWARVAKEAGMKGIIITLNTMMDSVFGLPRPRSTPLKIRHGKMVRVIW